MNKNIEIQKIKVNNGQELIQKAKEYKNSGGEWKLLERYIELPDGENHKEHLNWGIIISNGNKVVNIYMQNEGRKTINAVSEYDSRNEVIKIFPEYKFALFNYGGKEGINTGTYKSIKEKDGECRLYRYLVAEDHWHLKQILNEYVQENEVKVYKSTNPHFSGWVEIIDGQDVNMYLYVGEKNDGGGREIKIGIKKEEFESCKRDEADSPSKALEDFWVLFTLGRPRTPAEEKKYYSSNGGLEENWQTTNKFWEKTCRWTLEQLRNDLMKGQEFWDNEPNEETRTKEIRAINQKISQINNRLEDMKKNQPEWYNNYDKFCPDCGHRMCCHHWGNCGKSKKSALLHNLEGENDNQSSTSPKSNNKKNNQISDSEKSQILQYFVAKNIKKITLNNGKLIIEYNGGAKKVIEKNKDQQLQKYYQFIQSLPSQSLSLNELQNNNTNNSTTPNKNNTVIYISLAVGAFILGGIFVYFLTRKKKK